MTVDIVVSLSTLSSMAQYRVDEFFINNEVHVGLGPTAGRGILPVHEQHSSSSSSRKLIIIEQKYCDHNVVRLSVCDVGLVVVNSIVQTAVLL